MANEDVAKQSGVVPKRTNDSDVKIQSFSDGVVPKRTNDSDVKIQSFSDGVAHFKRHDRMRVIDVQVPRPLTLSWNCDGTRLAAGAEKGVAVVTFDSSYRTKNIFNGFGHTEQVDQVAFHPSNPFLLTSASADRTVRIWDIRQTRTHTRLTTKAQNLNVSWAPCGTYFIYGDKEDTLNMIDARSLKTLKAEILKEETNEFTFHCSGKYLFVALGSGKFSIYQMPEFKLLRTVQAHSSQSTCICLTISPDGNKFAVGASDAICSVWLTRDLICEYNISRLDYSIRSVSFSANSHFIATASEDHWIDIAWAATGERIHELRINAETFTCAWHPYLYLLAYASAPAIGSRDRDIAVKLFGFAT